MGRSESVLQRYCSVMAPVCTDDVMCAAYDKLAVSSFLKKRQGLLFTDVTLHDASSPTPR